MQNVETLGENVQKAGHGPARFCSLAMEWGREGEREREKEGLGIFFVNPV